LIDFFIRDGFLIILLDKMFVNDNIIREQAQICLHFSDVNSRKISFAGYHLAGHNRCPSAVPPKTVPALYRCFKFL